MTPSPLVISDQLWQLKEVYKGRHLIENFFASIKGYRGSATRYDKTDSGDAANWNLVAALLTSRSILLSTGPGCFSSSTLSPREAPCKTRLT